MVIDFHTHAFIEKVAEKAMTLLAASSGNLLRYADGTVPGMLENMRAQQTDRSVVLNIAATKKQMAAVNDFAIELDRTCENIVSFGSVYPFAPNAGDELQRLKENGIKGIKLHPFGQDFVVDDERLFGLYDTIRGLGLITVFHAGFDLGYPSSDKASPERFAKILPLFGEAPVVLAHMGGCMMWDGALEHLCGRDVYFDTASCYSRIPLPMARKIAELHGPERILYGTDLPWSERAIEERFVDALGLAASEKDMVMGGNAARLLGL